VHFDMYSVSQWSSPSDCWHAVNNCLSYAVNAGAVEAYCVASSWTTVGDTGKRAECRGGCYPTIKTQLR
jgi:hypothetical protein